MYACPFDYKGSFAHVCLSCDAPSAQHNIGSSAAAAAATLSHCFEVAVFVLCIVLPSEPAVVISKMGVV